MSQFSLSWQNINVIISENHKTFWKTTVKKKTILHKVSGNVESGVLNAVLGNSGCGKTTLLSAISGRFRQKTGTIQINNNVITDKTVRNISGFLYQQDIFTECLTVFEHLQFIAALQLSVTQKMRNSIIKKQLAELNLMRQIDTLIKNLSGGERRRLSLAGELITNPHILFCDEPTTGLDSYNAIVVIKKLRTIALSGKLVLATIHQPSSQLFHYFDNITLMAEGQLVFQGSRDKANSFFESMNLYCPSAFNPAEFYIKCLTEEDVSKMCHTFMMQKNETRGRCMQWNNFSDSFPEKKIEKGFLNELRWLLWRCYLNTKRNKIDILGTYFYSMVQIFIISLCYSKVTVTSQDGVQNIQGLLSYCGTEFTFTNMYAVIYIFPQEVALYLREKSLYSAYSYFISKILSLIPLSLISTMVCLTTLFIILRFLNGFYLWLKMTYLIFLVAITSSSLGLAFSATFSTIEQVDLFLGPLETLLLLFSGMLLKVDTVSSVFSWVKYVSPFYYAFDSLSNLYWRDVVKMENCAANQTLQCYYNGTEILKTYGIYKNYDTVAYDILYLHILGAAFCLMGFAGVLRKKILYSI